VFYGGLPLGREMTRQQEAPSTGSDNHGEYAATLQDYELTVDGDGGVS